MILPSVPYEHASVISPGLGFSSLIKEFLAKARLVKPHPTED